LDRNQYSTMLPGYLSLGASYTKIERIVPSPTKILREPMPNEKYCIYAAFGGNTPAKSEVSDEQYDYVPPAHVICAADLVFIDHKRKYKKKSKDFKSVRTEEWLFDSGASIHVMPNKHLLLNSKPCSILIRVANRRYISASLVVDVLLKCKCGSLLLLCGVLYSPMFNKNIISAPQLLQSKEYKITMLKSYVAINYQGKVLNMKFKSTANLYVLDAVC
jgi:hypothetical protein